MSGKTTLVSNSIQLKIAATAAKAGDTILLAAGSYGDYSFSAIRPTGTVTIKPVSDDAQVTFRTMSFTNSANLVVENIDVSRPLVDGVGMNTPMLRVNSSTNISLVNFDVAGSRDGNAGNDGHGLSIVSSSRISVLDSHFEQVDTAAIIARVQDVIFAGNTITAVREGVNISNTQGGLFDRNTIVNMQPSYDAGDHPDAFQVHSTRTAASSDLAFRNNVILEGTSGPVGGFFIRSERVGEGIEHSNISIENNYYQGTYRHGISVGDTNGLVIRGNTVIDSAKAGNSAAINTYNIEGGRIENNIAQLFLQSKSSGVTLANNIDVWEAKFNTGIKVAELFAPAGDVGVLDFAKLDPLAGSLADVGGSGFRLAAGIGDLTGGTAALLGAYVPQFDSNFATVFQV
jgi:parallel beta-helix repeat protein